MKSSPRDNACWFSKIFFTWLYPLLWTGRKKTLTIHDDLYEVHSSDKSSLLLDQLEKSWKAEISKAAQTQSTPSFLAALRSIYGLQYFLLGLTAFIEECAIRIGQPLCLGLLMQHFRGAYSNSEGWLFAGGVVFLSAWYVTQHHPFFFALQHNGMKMRVATSALIYKKALRLSLSSLEKTSQGTLINLMSSDVTRLDLSKDFMHYIWIAPCQLIIVILILWGYFGWVSLVGVTLLVAFIPFQSGMGKLFGAYRAEISTKTDKRLRVINQVLKGISSIKMYAWESAFVHKVTTARVDEVKMLRKTSTLRALNQSLYYVACKIVVFAILLVYFLLDNTLTPEKVFVTLALFNNVRMTLTLFLPYGISQFAEIRVAIQRIQNYLLLEERQGVDNSTNSILPSPNESPEETPNNSPSKIELRSVCAKWDCSSTELTLKNISFSVESGELLGIIGPVGSGKSSILAAILRELPVSSGSLELTGSSLLTAYASQDPWIFMGTLRDNILFDKQYDPQKFAAVVEACALSSDFAQFPNGDLTRLVDEKSLSGGQRARISLARAAYSDADVFLLDDPLSAVDAKVGRHIHEKLIAGLLRSKVVVLVTHQHKFLRGATNVVALNSNGSVQMRGTYEEILQAGLLSNSQADDTEEIDLEHVAPSPPAKEKSSEDESPPLQPQLDLKSKGEEGRGATEEAINSEEVGLGLYWKYLKSGCSFASLSFMIGSNILAQLLYSGSDYWLKVWTKTISPAESQAPKNASAVSSSSFLGRLETDGDLQIGVYSGIIGLLLLSAFLRTSSFFHICMNASVALHNRLFSSLLQTKLHFFDKTPSGRILNRFSKDMATIDDTLPLVLFDTIEVSLQVVGILLVVSLISPILTIPAVFVCVSFVLIRRLYLQTAKTLKRLEGAARSPIISQLNSTLNGLTTIRAFGAESKVERDFLASLDVHSSTWYVFLATTRWLGVTVDWVSIIYILCVTLVIMVTNSGDADAGLALTSAMALTGLMQWGVKQSSEAASQMISVERVLEYSHLPPEQSLPPPTEDPGNKPWPTSGNIQFCDVSLSYEPTSPAVLKHLTFNVEGGHRIGIVGRTGAGKSSLISALLRLEEPAGSILIDGVDSKSISLHRLRTHISIIPQSPMLFTDSLRANLDPLGVSSDAQLTRILQDVQLNGLPNGLETQVEDEGSNFSGGQRQLICLGRALLRNSKILILDEATASMDFDTDALIQEAIRTKFTDATVLVVAHRLNTVLDSDRILVLDAGTIQEYDDPKTLLQDESSALSVLVKHSQAHK